jgi:hypothetical protein
MMLLIDPHMVNTAIAAVLRHFNVELGSVYGRGEQPNTKSEPGAVATGRILKFFKAFVLPCFHFTVESLTGRYRSRF